MHPYGFGLLEVEQPVPFGPDVFPLSFSQIYCPFLVLLCIGSYGVRPGVRPLGAQDKPGRPCLGLLDSFSPGLPALMGDRMLARVY